MQYQNQDIFVAKVIRSGYRYLHRNEFRSKPLIHLSFAKNRSYGLHVEDIYCNTKTVCEELTWSKMESKKLQTNELVRFTVRLQDINCSYIYPTIQQFNFEIKMISRISNYYYQLMDEAWLKDLWTAATDQKLTDVDIFVGTNKVMEAHRIILSARSPVLNIVLNKASSLMKSIVTFGAEFNVDIVTLFLQFLYTGSLENANKDINYKQLLELATFYEVETLKNFCQVASAFPPDVEDLTSSLLEL
jgi:hypothetical protein